MNRQDWTVLAVIGISALSGMGLTSMLYQRFGAVEAVEPVVSEGLTQVEIILFKSDPNLFWGGVFGPPVKGLSLSKRYGPNGHTIRLLPLEPLKREHIPLTSKVEGIPYLQSFRLPVWIARRTAVGGGE